MSLLLSLLAFGAGAWLLVESVEGLVKALTGWAAAAGLSGLALSALVLGFDIESTGAGVAATLDGLPGTALGTSVGAAVFLVTIGVGRAAVVAPLSVRTPARCSWWPPSRPPSRSPCSPTGPCRGPTAPCWSSPSSPSSP